MSFGQHTEGTRHYYPQEPVVGRRTRADVLDGLNFTSAKKTAHNEWTRETVDGARIVRLLATDIVYIAPSGKALRIDNGGWHTPTTARHINEALAREGFKGLYVWNQARRRRHPGRTTMDGRPERQDGRGELVGEGGMVLRVTGSDVEIPFRQSIEIARFGEQWTPNNYTARSDLDD